ncbi:GNAT family N-acetyltransferase [Halobacillus litoralis]|uniref:GNAT family N-acetyltransferase n=1 Tax=Halobacillus litoralis TaxID=45668 RepID=UPI001CD50667|nr:GNAT family N-acetyltransferase [Halobacillus litoralis]MCA0972592.1 GNAT family N-acetyltransferase [Halobacillus litoralis]
MILVREPKEKDLMHFTRYAIEHFRLTLKNGSSEAPDNEALRERKFWAADQLFANSDHQRLLVAEREGEVLGYILGTVDRDVNGRLCGCVEEIFVDEFYRREGVGTTLCRELMEWMQGKEVEGIRLNLLAGYPRAAAFFEAIGFTPLNTLYKWNPE